MMMRHMPLEYCRDESRRLGHPATLRLRIAAVGMLAILSQAGHATGLDPLAYPSNNDAVFTGNVAINTDLGSVNGSFSFQSTLTSGIRVFAFDSLSVAPGALISVVGSRPLALLARQSVMIAG